MAHGCCWPRGGCQRGGGSRGQGVHRGLHSLVILKGILEPEELSSAEPGPAKPGNKSTGGCRVVINICWMVMEGGLSTGGEIAGWGPWEGRGIWQLAAGFLPSTPVMDGGCRVCASTPGVSAGAGGDAPHTNTRKTKHWGSAGVSWGAAGPPRLSPWGTRRHGIAMALSLGTRRHRGTSGAKLPGALPLPCCKGSRS